MGVVVGNLAGAAPRHGIDDVMDHFLKANQVHLDAKYSDPFSRPPIVAKGLAACASTLDSLDATFHDQRPS
jgi:hypothetical protein